MLSGLLKEIALGAGTETRVVAARNGPGAGPDPLELDRIERERARSTTRYLRDRDWAKLDAATRELDRAVEVARTRKAGAAVPAEVAVRYLRDLPGTWRAAEGGPGRQMLASALFCRIEVLGLQEATVHITDDAVRHGVAGALPAEVAISVSGRGERARASLTQQSLRFLMINRTPRESLRATARSA
jgi:hypothetical protein